MSILTFLVPLVAAVAGAWLADQNALSELLGGCGGLVAGMLAVRAWVPAERGAP